MGAGSRSTRTRAQAYQGIRNKHRPTTAVEGLRNVPSMNNDEHQRDLSALRRRPTADTFCPPLDLATIRTKLSGERGQHYWRSLEEIAETKEFKEMLQREFPAGATEWWDSLSRRNFLKMAAASLALSGLTACTKQPAHEILPYVKQPEGLVLGEPLFYATAMVLGGFATGVLVKSREGHPIKIEGNPEHPSSVGASSIWGQASILD